MKYLKHAREKKELSQDKLAELSGVPQNTISRIERGLRLKPQVSTLQKLARVLDVEQPLMLTMDVATQTLDQIIEATPEERRAYIELRRETGRLIPFIRNLERIFRAAIADSSGEPQTRAQLEVAFLLGYARAIEDAAQLEQEHRAKKEEQEVTVQKIAG